MVSQHTSVQLHRIKGQMRVLRGENKPEIPDSRIFKRRAVGSHVLCVRAEFSDFADRSDNKRAYSNVVYRLRHKRNTRRHTRGADCPGDSGHILVQELRWRRHTVVGKTDRRARGKRTYVRNSLDNGRHRRRRHQAVFCFGADTRLETDTGGGADKRTAGRARRCNINAYEKGGA